MEEKETLAERKLNRVVLMLLIIIALLIMGLGGIAMLILRSLH